MKSMLSQDESQVAQAPVLALPVSSSTAISPLVLRSVGTQHYRNSSSERTLVKEATRSKDNLKKLILAAALSFLLLVGVGIVLLKSYSLSSKIQATVVHETGISESLVIKLKERVSSACDNADLCVVQVERHMDIASELLKRHQVADSNLYLAVEHACKAEAAVLKLDIYSKAKESRNSEELQQEVFRISQRALFKHREIVSEVIFNIKRAMRIRKFEVAKRQIQRLYKLFPDVRFKGNKLALIFEKELKIKAR